MPRPTPALTNIDKVKAAQPKWLWYPYIPANGATMIFGPGGIGKSYLTIEIAARLSRGETLPGQVKAQTTGEHKVLLMTAEDSLSAVVRQRLENQGAKLSNIFAPAEAFELDEWGMRLMKRYVEESEATIIIIDPVAHWMGGKIDINKMNEVRALTGGLHQYGLQTDLAVMLIHHSRKGKEDDGDDIEKAVGSIDLVNAVRSVMSIGKAPDGTPVMRHLKTNYGTFGKSLAYYIDEEGLHWIGEYGDEDSLRPSRVTNREQARSFLNVALSHGPVPAKEIIAAAKDEGIPLRTLNRAKVDLAESIMRVINGERRWYWRSIVDEREPEGIIGTH